MGIRSWIFDQRNKRAAYVDENNALRVSMYHPDVPEPHSTSRFRFYRRDLSHDGTDSGSTSMNVDGSSTSQEFYRGSQSDSDLYIMAAAIVIADFGVAHNNFGALNTLNTGWDLKIEQQGETSFLIEKATTGGEVIIQSGLAEPYGDNQTAFELGNFNATDDATTVHFPFHRYIPGGLRLARGTADRVVSVVNDDLSGLTDFTVSLFGYRHFPFNR